MLLLLFFLSVFFLARSLLIFIGLLKGPILDTCAKYGPEDYPYLSLLPLVTWFGVFGLTLGAWLLAAYGAEYPVVCPGILLLLLAGLGYRYYDVLAGWHLRWVKYPRWYAELMERTTRYERRRIAYAWLRLPRRLRLTYNSNTEAFLTWADFVIMSTISEAQETPRGVYWPPH
jgi:hypothetical protein